MRRPWRPGTPAGSPTPLCLPGPKADRALRDPELAYRRFPRRSAAPPAPALAPLSQFPRSGEAGGSRKGAQPTWQPPVTSHGDPPSPPNRRRPHRGSGTSDGLPQPPQAHAPPSGDSPALSREGAGWYLLSFGYLSLPAPRVIARLPPEGGSPGRGGAGPARVRGLGSSAWPLGRLTFCAAVKLRRVPHLPR